MFSLREFIKKGLLDAVGHMADYQIILNAAGWLEKGVLTEDDLAAIEAAIDALHEAETPVEDAEDTEDAPEAGESEATV